MVNSIDLVGQRVNLRDIDGIKRIELIGKANATALNAKKERFGAALEVKGCPTQNADVSQIFGTENSGKELLRANTDSFYSNAHPLLLYRQDAHRFGPEISVEYVPRSRPHWRNHSCNCKDYNRSAV
jgi:hypothetical protein